MARVWFATMHAPWYDSSYQPILPSREAPTMLDIMAPIVPTVSLVKHYFAAGWSMPGCLPESAQLFATLDEARAYLAGELDRAADEMFATELDNARLDYSDIEQYEANYSEAHSDSASMSASAELIRSDRDGDIAWSVGGRYGRMNQRGWYTSEPNGYRYWIEPAAI